MVILHRKLINRTRQTERLSKLVRALKNCFIQQVCSILKNQSIALVFQNGHYQVRLILKTEKITILGKVFKI